VGKPSSIGQPTRPTQPFIPLGSMNEQSAAIGCLLPQLGVAPSGERLRRKGRHGVICRWSMPLCEYDILKRRYTNSLPFLSFLFPRNKSIGRTTSCLQTRSTRSATSRYARRSSLWEVGRYWTPTGRRRAPPTGRWRSCWDVCAAFTTRRCWSKRSSPPTTRTPVFATSSRRHRDVILTSS